jgi:hypothetical protein
MLAKRGRGRPKGHKNKRPRSIDEALTWLAWRNLPAHMTPGAIRQRRNQLKQLVEEGIRHEKAWRIRNGFSEEECAARCRLYQLEYEEWEKAIAEWKVSGRNR